MSSNAFILHRSPDMNTIVNNTYNNNDNNKGANIVNIAKLSHQSRTRTGSTSSVHSLQSNNNNAKSNNTKLYSKINFDEIPSLSTDIPRSAIHLSPLQFAQSIPIFRRERFDLFGLHGKYV